MPKVVIEHPHSLEPSAVKQRLDQLNTRLAEKYGIEAQWRSDTEATFKRTGASGTIRCQPGKVVIAVDLSFALSPIKGKVEDRIRDELARALA